VFLFWKQLQQVAPLLELHIHAPTSLSKSIMQPLYRKHQDDIITGQFSSGMMADWAKGDADLLRWRAETGETAFEKTPAGKVEIPEQEYFDNGVLMVAMVKAGVELAYEEMVKVGIKPESAYYESLHETPLIANTIARKKLFEMNRVISDTAEYGCYLFDQAAKPLLSDFMSGVTTDVIGKKFNKDEMINKYTYARCLEQSNVTISKPCMQCYVGAAAFGADNCAGKCMFSWCSKDCLACNEKYRVGDLKTCVGADTPNAEVCEKN